MEMEDDVEMETIGRCFHKDKRENKESGGKQCTKETRRHSKTEKSYG